MPSHHCVLNSVAECREEPGSPPHTLQCLPTLPTGFCRPPVHMSHAEQSLCSQSPIHSRQCVASRREQLGHHQKVPAQISDGGRHQRELPEEVDQGSE